MKRFVEKGIARLLSLFPLAGLIATGLVMGCAAQTQEMRVGAIPTIISGTVFSDTGKTISEAKVVAYWKEQQMDQSKEIMSGLDGSFVLELPGKPFAIEASKPEYFKAVIKPKEDSLLIGLKFMLESGGRINILTKGMEKEELPFFRAKASVAGREYFYGDKIFVPIRFDIATGKALLQPFRDGVNCIISGVPAGPAEVQVGLYEENLSVQTVQVKGGATANVEFRFNKVFLSGKVTNLGAPLSDWLLIFKRADGKPVVGTSGTKTLADGWYDFKLRPGIYQIQLCAPGVFMINGVSVKGHELKYTRIHFVTKTETLNLDVSGLAPYVPKQR